MNAFVRMHAHGAVHACTEAVGGKLILSRLSRGESHVLSRSPSIKMVVEGEEIHEVDGRPYWVRPGQMLIVDRGQPYSGTIRRNVSTAGMCLYLPPEQPSSLPQLEDAPLLGRALVQSVNSPLGRLLQRYAVTLHKNTEMQADVDLLIRQVRAELDAELLAAADRMAALDVRKTSTRHEVMNRLEYARAYLHEHLERAVTLGELAGVAGLSSFHLARHFSSAFGAPPARYHRKIRLEHATTLIRKGELTITEIAHRAGYSELSAFTHAFRRQFGTAPSAFTSSSR